MAPPPKLKLDVTDCWPAKVGKLAAVPNGETADCGLEVVRENPPKAGAEICVQLNIFEHCSGIISAIQKFQNTYIKLTCGSRGTKTKLR